MMNQLERLIGVYEADGGFLGELRYAMLKLSGRGHCSLCDITHRGIKQKPEWSTACNEFNVPFDLVHLNERSPLIRQASDGSTPCVLAKVEQRILVVLDPTQLEACGGDVATFTENLRLALSANDILLP